MSNEILFYDISIQSPTHPNKCYAPNTLYEYPLQRRPKPATDLTIGYPVQFVMH